jgi:hypothetical protein|tara:strand:+ start:1713 stop:1814 length:102 start_codon:yes stop_codon:yes gene_type:complete
MSKKEIKAILELIAELQEQVRLLQESVDAMSAP